MGPDTKEGPKRAKVLGSSARELAMHVVTERPREDLKAKRKESPKNYIQTGFPVTQSRRQWMRKQGQSRSMEQIAALQYKASYYEALQEENASLRGKMDALSAQLEKGFRRKGLPKKVLNFRTLSLVKMMNDQMQNFRRLPCRSR